MLFFMHNITEFETSSKKQLYNILIDAFRIWIPICGELKYKLCMQVGFFFQINIQIKLKKAT
jgi:hypothetical protein